MGEEESTRSSFWKKVSCELAFVTRGEKEGFCSEAQRQENVSVSHSSDHSFTASVATSSHYCHNFATSMYHVY